MIGSSTETVTGKDCADRVERAYINGFYFGAILMFAVIGGVFLIWWGLR